MSARRIALVGDCAEEKVAHRAIPRALAMARDAAGLPIEWEWIETGELAREPESLDGFAGVWLVPGSPYRSPEAALGAVRWAREGGRPFLGTCGGFQHALLGVARDLGGLAGAAHAETDPEGTDLVVTPLSCSLVGQSGRIHFAAGSRIAAAYGAASATEAYHCNFGFNEGYRPRLEAAGLRFTAWDDAGQVRGAELPAHPFFVGTLFQPERGALAGTLPALAAAFAAAVAAG